MPTYGRVVAGLALGLWLFGPARARAQFATITRVDSAGDVGRYSSVAFRPGGLALISYYDATNQDLKVASCLDTACTAATLSTLDSAGDVGAHTSIAIGSDGFGLVSYYDATNAVVKVAHCTDVTCTAATSIALGSLTGSAPLRGTALAIGADGRAVIAFGGDGLPLRVARCADASCSAATTASTAFGASHRPALAIGSDGRPLLAADDGFGVSLAHCLDAACSGATVVNIPGQSAPPFPPGGTTIQNLDASIAVGADGLLTLVHRRVSQNTPPLPGGVSYLTAFRRCVDLQCSALTAPQYLFGVSPFDLALAIGGTGAPLLAQHVPSSSGGFLTAVSCPDPTCSSVDPETIDGPGVGEHASLARGPAGLGLVAYYDGTNGDLKTAFLSDTPNADLSLSILDTPDPVAPGQLLRYQLLATNQGQQLATGVSAHMTLPPETTFVTAIPICLYEPAPHAIRCQSPDVPAGHTVLVGRVDVRLTPVEPRELIATATVLGAVADPDPADNAASASTLVAPWIGVTPASTPEGDFGIGAARFELTLHSTVPSTRPAIVDFETVPGTATASRDYSPIAGTLVLPAGTATATVDVPVVGDTLVEGDETFTLQLTTAQGTAIGVPTATGTIVDDDVAVAPSGGQLDHGGSRWADLDGGTPDFYRLAQAPYSSYEVVVDAVSGDVRPLGLARLAGDGTTLLQTASAAGTGTSVALAWINSTAAPSLSQLVRVSSGGCTSGCGTDDVYRIRAYETTLRAPRFNNAGGQVTVLALQNPFDRTIAGRAWFWRADGTLAGTTALTLGPRASIALNTSSVAPGISGSVVVGHDGPYGAIRGKTVSLEPATGFSFDTPLEVRPR